MARLVQLQPIDPGVTQGGRTTFGEAVSSGFASARTMGSVAENQRHGEVYGGWTTVFDKVIQGYLDLPTDLGRDVAEQGFSPDEATLGRLMEWAQGSRGDLGFEITPDMAPAAVMQRRDEVYARDAELVAREQEVLGRASPFSRTAGALIGGVMAEFGDPINLATLPAGAPARVGLLGTVLIEAGINAAIEAADTPNRNAIAAQLGQEGGTVLGNAALGAVFGGAFAGAIKGAALGLNGLSRLGRLIPDRRALVDIAEASTDPEANLIAGQLRRDMEDEEAATDSQDAYGVREHQERAQEASQAIQEGRAPVMPDRPTFAVPRGSIINGEIEEINPRDLLVQPDVFQFRSNVVAEGGQTQRLLDVTEWHSERAGVVIVYEYADGSRAIADGHQRTGLAIRIMDQTGQEIRMAAKVFREVDGFSPEDIRTLAALKNIAEASDGMSTAMARDAARVLRVSPEAIAQLPAGPGIVRAQALARLSDEAFDMFINEVVPERFAELVGRMVDNPEMHAAMMQLLRRTGPDTTAQAESILAQALQAPVSREITADLFGEQEIVESLYLERAKVLERAMRIMRDDRSVFRTLDERADRIQGTGSNRLDTATNKQTRQQVEQALAAVQKLAHRAGPISEALNDGARNYRENGRLKDAAQRVADAVRQEVERNGLAGARAGDAGRNAEPSRASATAPDPLEGFSDPVNGEGAKAQIEGTRLDANERPADSTTDNPAGLADLKVLVSRNAPRPQIDNHPAVVQALDELEARAAKATNLEPDYGTDEWHQRRIYRFGDQEEVGTEAALPFMVKEAEAQAGGPPRRDRLATIVLGPPAAGKSTIANSLAVTKRAAVLDSDDIKKALPEYEGGIGAARVHEESSDLADAVEELLRAKGTNIVYPKVGGSPASIRRVIERFRADGYIVEVVNMAVTTDNAYRRMIGRFVDTGRIIPPRYVDEVGESPAATYRTLKEESLADGYAEIDNNGGFGEPKPITDRAGRNPLAGSDLDGDLSPSGRQGDVSGKPGAAQDRGQAPVTERTDAGDQGLFDGIEPITERTRLEQRMGQPLGRGGDAGNDSQIGGLFDPNDPGRFDLFDAVPIDRGFDADGKEVAITMTRAELAAELDADDAAVDLLDICVKG